MSSMGSTWRIVCLCMAIGWCAVFVSADGSDGSLRWFNGGGGGNSEGPAGDSHAPKAESGGSDHGSPGDASGGVPGPQEGKSEPSAWRIGRATYYGDEPWAWSIHEGSCGYGDIWEDEPLGWDVAALPDVHYEFAGSCGKCYEVACNPMGFNDNYGNHLDRNNVCQDSSKSVVVKITDTCPCNYATNSYSNKRWCCGDMDHFDLSIWAFEKLAEKKWGVIGLKYRPVPCDYEPSNPAPKPQHPHHGPPPPEPRPWWLPKKQNDQVHPTPSSPRISPHPKEPRSLFHGGIQNGWFTKQWNAKKVPGWTGPSGGDAFCAQVYPHGAIGLESNGGDFWGRVSMELWFRTDDGVPDVKLQLAGYKECGMLELKDLQPTGDKVNGFSRYMVYLGLFDFGAHIKRVVAFASEFHGCGGNDAGSVKNLYIRNNAEKEQFICVDKVTLI
ncbi:hypothetical protein BSKO_07270 [Bryopsis sp. KO-2023]|nr:hypothetical protein BSKO_07270 [Bryopsis sp. KO-2023]